MFLKKVFTIGVYGLTANEFFEKLKASNVTLFIDIRRRRAVRGSKYSFVNSTKLQESLKALDINYLHLIELAPTNEIRQLQKSHDLIEQVNKTERQELGQFFIREYTQQILDRYDLSRIIDYAQEINAENVVLFCVETFYRACHRSIVSKRINELFQIPICHL